MSKATQQPRLQRRPLVKKILEGADDNLLVIAGLVIVVSYAEFASPLVVLIAFAASLCCASSIAEFA